MDPVPAKIALKVSENIISLLRRLLSEGGTSERDLRMEGLGVGVPEVAAETAERANWVRWH